MFFVTKIELKIAFIVCLSAPYEKREMAIRSRLIEMLGTQGAVCLAGSRLKAEEVGSKAFPTVPGDRGSVCPEEPRNCSRWVSLL